MSTRRSKPPKLCLHKATGQAFVRIAGKPLYLGKYGTPDAQRKYAQLLTQLAEQDRSDEEAQANAPAFQARACDDLTICELLTPRPRVRGGRGAIRRQASQVNVAGRPRRLFPSGGYAMLRTIASTFARCSASSDGQAATTSSRPPKSAPLACATLPPAFVFPVEFCDCAAPIPPTGS